ncbi:WYL domain-containing protein [Paenibacillus pasadenensis]|uniref:helix-turn-helix transcriptional regulator n=1 Tax=Paenibacillus pasadenensis TaxID=217090 RepID=UPI00203BDA10|nr:WYL domain-containing protein [Paenibacillus pasadenensis]MCM3746686.1 WYL domain-containing protein [Paenibacillus pasadenensis]
MKGERLLELLLLLQAEGKLSAKELSERLEVSERTIHRDMESLSAAGIPVLAERGSSGGWRLMDGYRTRLTGLDAEEWKALLIASQSRAAHDLGWSSTLDSALLKLRAAHPQAVLPHASALQSRLLIDGEDWHTAGLNQPHLNALMEAVLQNRLLRFHYVKNGVINGPPPNLRLAAPLALVLKGSSWYLIADELQNATDDDEAPPSAAGMRKTFRVSRIADAELDSRSFKRPESFDLASWWAGSLARFRQSLPQPIPAKLLLKPDALERLSRMRYVRVLNVWCNDASLYPAAVSEGGGKYGDGAVNRSEAKACTASGHEEWLQADAEFDTEDYAASIILSLAPGAVALEPASLTGRIRQLALKAAGLHSSADSTNE